mgnify:CR=1 FL=1
MSEQKKIKVTLVKSLIGTIESHRACARGLGLRRREKKKQNSWSPFLKTLTSQSAQLQTQRK